MAPIAHHTILGALALLEKLGTRFGTVIDVGCADGHFIVEQKVNGLLKGASVLNIDPLADYEPSLQRIQAAIGGHYRICAIGERDGEIAISTGAHPYWASTRPAGDAYWDRILGAPAQTTAVKLRRLDDLVAELALKPPFLLKLDVQGGEVGVLRGAPRTLGETDAVIVEVDIEDFAPIHAALEQAGLVLFDLTQFNRAPDETLGWFYPIYVSRRVAAMRQRGFWTESQTPEIVAMQQERRRLVAQMLDQQLPRLDLARRMGML